MIVRQPSHVNAFYTHSIDIIRSPYIYILCASARAPFNYWQQESKRNSCTMALVFAIILFLFWQVLAQENGLTYEVVESRINSFRQSRNSASTAESSRPSGCALAVRNCLYKLLYIKLTHVSQCSFLDFVLPGQVSFPNSTIYQYEESRYWSTQQASDEPICRFSPNCAPGVSLAVLTAQVTQCQFAVKSGGHAAFSGSSNINGGITIDLLDLNEIVVSEDQTQTGVGPGNRWANVYSVLDARNISVIGGRVADIGVGGLTLGGGISFFSARYGWACDNVIAYEVCALFF